MSGVRKLQKILRSVGPQVVPWNTPMGVVGRNGLLPRGLAVV
jgi:hypothetical protein